MSKKNDTVKTDSLKENKNDEAKQIVYVPQQQNSQYLVNLLMFIIAILAGMLIQQYFMSNNKTQELTTSNSQAPFLNQEIVAPKPTKPLVDMEEIYKEMSERLKKELLDAENRKNSQKESSRQDTKRQDDIINEKKVVIDDKMVDDDSGIQIKNSNGNYYQKINPNGEPVEFESNGIKFKVNTKNEPDEGKVKEAENERKLKEEQDLKRKEEAERKRKAEERERKKKEAEDAKRLKKENEKKNSR
jgi:hypothetical protein